MIPIAFPEANMVVGSPKELPGSCLEIQAHARQIVGGIWDGSNQVIVAWQPSQDDISRIVNGHPIYLATIGNLPPHLLSTVFENLLV